MNLQKDLAGDFLEMACFLNPDQSGFLLRELACERFAAETLEVHPCFSINGVAIVVSEQPELRECWIYFPKAGEIRKLSL